MKILILFVAIVLQLNGMNCSVFDRGILFNSSTCSLSPSIVAEIRSYKAVANSIFNEATKNSFKHKTFKDLRSFVNRFGPRPTGSVQLERSLTFLQRKLTGIGLTNVHSEAVIVPKLVRYG